MSVLNRDALEGSPLADLHAIASELGLDGFRRLRKADLVDKILEATGGAAADDGPAAEEESAAPRRRSRGGRGRAKTKSTDDDADADAEPEPAASKDDDAEESDGDAAPRTRSRRGGRGRSRNGGEDRDSGRGDRDRGERSRGDRDRGDGPSETEEVVSGTVELLANGSGFLRVAPPEPSDDDVYISAAQVRRCELVSGDTVTGPRRAPRRSERYPSLVRIDTINGKPADEVAEGTPFEELPATFPTERLALGSEDVTLKAIEWLTPIGRGSRVTIVGPARSGKSEALRLLAGALVGQDGIETTLVLAGVRPEELGLAPEGLTPVAAMALSASADARGQAIERAVDTAKRVAARGGHAVVLIDTLEGVHEGVARRALAAARAVVDGGSLTVVATASAPIGGETTVIAMDQTLASTGRFPAVDLVASGTLKPELLVGAAGAEAIAAARASALG
ncbi:Rho termination factor N-terminal domain-containing protein [Paraconexibacter sp.]|uniref:Rho termination factor N-terminal domain-containing protein n=1 Tax=Paraconexibacter sp. TaxID=2949640 RepID=UPI00356483D9